MAELVVFDIKACHLNPGGFMKVWLNGKIVKDDDAKISVKTHSLHYGTSVFEGIRFYETEKGAAIFRLKEHIDRLFNSADALSMNAHFSRTEIEEASKELIRVNDVKEGYLRPVIFYGEGLSVYPKDISVNCAIMIVKWEKSEDGLRVKVSKFRRVNKNASVSGVKMGGYYVNSVLAMEDARRSGYDEALLLDEEGIVSEGPAHNLFAVKDGLLVTSASKSALHGITSSSILEIAKELGYTMIEKDLTLEEVKDSDELFFCATGAEIVWIKSVDEVRITDEIGEVTKKIKEKYFDAVRGKDKKYEHWLDYV